MRVAALYDVHGNLPALEAALAAVEAERPDRIVVGGDFAAGPMPAETLRLLRSLGDRAAFLHGNADRELLEPEEGGVWAERAAWAAAQLDDDARAFLAGLPATVVLDVDGLGPTLFCHGSPRSDEENLTRLTPAPRLRRILEGVEQRVVVCGHTHVQFDRTVGGVRVVNAGSVGLPYEAHRGAYWALLGPDVSLRRTPYDVDAAARRICAGDYPGADAFVRESLLDPPGPAEASAFFERLGGGG